MTLCEACGRPPSGPRKRCLGCGKRVCADCATKKGPRNVPLECLYCEQDDYRGNKGWVVVFGGMGRSVFVDVAPEFGSLRYWTQESGLYDPDECGLEAPSEGFWRANAHGTFSKDWESGHSDLDGFEVDGEWEQVEDDGQGGWRTKGSAK